MTREPGDRPREAAELAAALRAGLARTETAHGRPQPRLGLLQRRLRTGSLD